MAKFLAEHQEKKNEDGTLAYAGASWTEMRIGVVLLCWLIALVGLIVLAIGLLSCAVSPYPDWSVLSAWVAMASFPLYLAWFLDDEFSRKFRSVHFHADGAITTPNGLPSRFWRRRIGGSHANIASIESMHTKEGYDVVIISTGGDTILLSEGLARWQALKASVLLTNALQRMRQSKARVPVAAAVPRVPHEAMID